MHSSDRSPSHPAQRGGPALLLLALLIALAAVLPSAAAAQESPDPVSAAPAQGAAVKIYLPIVTRQFPVDLADRIGYSAGSRRPAEYSEIESLKAGWYVDWGTQIFPQQPGGMEYVQMVRVHQKIRETGGCGVRVTADRVRCPYQTPYTYTTWPDDGYITLAAQANRGSIWLIGNEPDRPDWEGGSQDEMLPEVYAQAYHHLYGVIKRADPTARIAVAGIIQMTDLREAYLDKMWQSYRDTYGADMPVDVWNVHNFVGSEYCERISGPELPGTTPTIRELNCHGMGLPPDALWEPGTTACSGSPLECKAAYAGEDWRHTHMPTFEAQIRRFRQWMKDHGQQNKELIITEYGVLYGQDIYCNTALNPRACKAAYRDGVVPLTNGDYVRKFMLDSFDFFLNTKDCSLSGVDDCRLVQRWAWFILDSGEDGYNMHGALFNADTKAITDTGKAYRNWVNANFATLRPP